MRILSVLLALSLLTGTAAIAQDAGERPFLGIAFSIEAEGALVREVLPGSPADDAGLQAGDLIVGVDGAEVAPEDLAATIQALDAGDEITLTVLRDGAELELETTLGSAPPEMPRAFRFAQRTPGGNAFSFDGARLVIERLVTEGPIAAAGLQPGDVIIAIDGQPLTPESLFEGDLDVGLVTITVERGDETLELEIFAEVIPFYGQGPLMGDDARPFAPDFPPEMPLFRVHPGQPLLGVEYLDLNAGVAAERELAHDEGALILRVMPESPAEAGGLLPDDIVTAVEGDPVDARRTLRERLLAYDPGETLQLELLRAGESIEVEVTLGEGTAMPAFGFRGRMMPPVGMMDLEALQERFGEDVDVEALLEAMMERFNRELDMEAWLERFGQQLQDEAPLPAPDV